MTEGSTKEPRIEPTPLEQPSPLGQAPQTTLSPAQVPESVRTAMQDWNDLKTSLRKEMQRDAAQNPELQKAWNLFQFLEQSVMNSVIAFFVNFFTNNLRTTVTGLVFVIGQLLAKYGLEMPQGFADGLFASTSFLLFMLSDAKTFSWRTVAGVVLMLAAFFFPYLAAFAGIAASPLTFYTAQVLLQGVISTLLKDQPNLLKYSPLNTAQKAGLLFISFLAASVPAPSQTTATMHVDTVSSFRAAPHGRPQGGTRSPANPDTSLRRVRAADEQRYKRLWYRTAHRAAAGAS